MSFLCLSSGSRITLFVTTPSHCDCNLILFPGACAFKALGVSQISACTISVHVNAWGREFNRFFVFSCPGWMENECRSAPWPGRPPCLPQTGSCWIQVRPQSVYDLLCATFHRIKNISLKRGSAFVFGMTDSWPTLVNGGGGEAGEREERHLPDKRHCAAVIPKRQMIDTAFSRSWKTVRDTVPGRNWLCFGNGGRLRVRSYLFAPSLQALVPETRRCYCSESQTQRDTEAEWERREGGRERERDGGFNGFFVQWRQ